MEIALFILYPLVLLSPRLLLAPLALHVVLISRSAVDYGRIPLVGLHDTLSFLAFCVGLTYLMAGWGRKRDLATVMTLPVILLLLAGSAASPAVTGPLPPVLKTAWFELHVILSFISYGLFAVGAVYGVLYLATNEQSAETNQYRLLLLGYILFSVAMIFGGIWAYLAWGTYWLWTPKELWTTIVWFAYSLYLHARLVQGWTGKRVAWIGIVGFFIVMFTYVGVGLLMKSSHEF